MTDREAGMSDLIVRRVCVDRTRSPSEMIKATQVFKDGTLGLDIPLGTGVETDVYFFRVGRYISNADLGKEYEMRGLKPADPYSVAAVNEADPSFVSDYPNATQWQEADGSWCFTAFYRWLGRRHMDVYRWDDGWDSGWWFAGLRKWRFGSQLLVP